MVKSLQLCRDRAAVRLVSPVATVYTIRPESQLKSAPEKGARMRSKSQRGSRKILFYIFRTWITRKDGSRDYARNHGFKAWRIPVYAT